LAQFSKDILIPDDEQLFVGQQSLKETPTHLAPELFCGIHGWTRRNSNNSECAHRKLCNPRGALGEYGNKMGTMTAEHDTKLRYMT